MIFSVESEVDGWEEALPFDAPFLAEQVCRTVLSAEHCPFEAEVSLLITDDEGIREINRTGRGIDAPTDVLSFPGLEYEEPGVFVLDGLNHPADVTDPETGAVRMGDIVLNLNRVAAQAAEYGHSRRREYAFLLLHAMLHLCGYDHMEEAEREQMEERQRVLMELLEIPREDEG